MRPNSCAVLSCARRGCVALATLGPAGQVAGPPWLPVCAKASVSPGRAISGVLAPTIARADVVRSARGRQSRSRARRARDGVERVRRAATCRGRVIVKFRDGDVRGARACALSSACRGRRDGHAPDRTRTSTSSRSMPDEDAEAVARALRQPADVEYAQAGLSRPHGSCRTIRSTSAAVEPAADRSGARLGHPAAGRLVDHRRGARYRRRVSRTRPSRRTLPAFIDDQGVHVSGARDRSTIPFSRGAAARQRRGRIASSRRTISSGTTTCRSISTATARTSAAPSAS